MKMDSIRIAGVITQKPHVVLEAAEFERRIFETKIEATRKSGTKDILIMQFGGDLISESDFEKMEKGQAVMIFGAIHTENERDFVPTVPAVKIFITAKRVILLDEINQKVNTVKLYGCICREPRTRITPKGKTITDLMICVRDRGKINFIPCICWGNDAEEIKAVKNKTYVELIGRMQSRDFRKQRKDEPPCLMTAYEVSVARLRVKSHEE